LAEAYARKLAIRVVTQVCDQVVERIRTPYADLIATVRSLRRDALPYRARHSAPEDGLEAPEDGLELPPLAELCPPTADEETVRLLIEAFAATGRRWLTGEVRSLPPPQQLPASMSNVLTDSGVRMRLGGFFAERVRLMVEHSLAPLRESIADRSQERSQAYDIGSAKRGDASSGFSTMTTRRSYPETAQR
jgi:hypothetical protein